MYTLEPCRATITFSAPVVGMCCRREDFRQCRNAQRWLYSYTLFGIISFHCYRYHANTSIPPSGSRVKIIIDFHLKYKRYSIILYNCIDENSCGRKMFKGLVTYNWRIIYIIGLVFNTNGGGGGGDNFILHIHVHSMRQTDTCIYPRRYPIDSAR